MPLCRLRLVLDPGADATLLKLKSHVADRSLAVSRLDREIELCRLHVAFSEDEEAAIRSLIL